MPTTPLCLSVSIYQEKGDSVETTGADSGKFGTGSGMINLS